MIDGASVGVLSAHTHTHTYIYCNSVRLIEFITEPMGNAIPAGPVINGVAVWRAKCLGNDK